MWMLKTVGDLTFKKYIFNYANLSIWMTSAWAGIWWQMSCLLVWMDASWHHSAAEKVDYRCDDNLNDGRIKQPFWSAQATSGQLCRFSHFPWWSVFFFLTSGRVILMLLSQRYSSLSVIGGRRGVGTTRGPSRQRCIKAAMSHPTCQAYRTVSKGGSSVPLFSPSRQSALSLPCLFASSLSFLTSYSHPL